MYWLIRQTSWSWHKHGLWWPYIKGWVTNKVGKNIWQQKHNEWTSYGCRWVASYRCKHNNEQMSRCKHVRTKNNLMWEKEKKVKYRQI